MLLIEEPRGSSKVRSVQGVAAAGILAVLAIVPYLPFLALPHISDDYLQIDLGRKWGSPSGWTGLASDVLYRCRATSILLTHWTEVLFGASPAVFRAESILLHVINTLLIAGLGWWKPVGWRVSCAAAAFFAVYEGHQEAVVWYAAVPELLVFLFAMVSLHCGLRWAVGGGRSASLYAACFCAFVLALFSKESAVVTVPLLAGLGWRAGVPARKLLVAFGPFASLSAVYTAAIFQAGPAHLHLNDGTFSLGAPFWTVIARSSFRLLWIWGLVALVSARVPRGVLISSGLWIVVTLLPFSFLTYMPHVPSRHTYWASVGLAFIVAAGWTALRNRKVALAVAAAIVIHNGGYLWLKKYPQYVRRAEPTEKLIRFAKQAQGPIAVRCFPYSMDLVPFVLRFALDPAHPAGSGVDAKSAAASETYCDPSKP